MLISIERMAEPSSNRSSHSNRSKPCGGSKFKSSTGTSTFREFSKNRKIQTTAELIRCTFIRGLRVRRCFPCPDFLIKVLSQKPEFRIYFEEEIPWQS